MSTTNRQRAAEAEDEEDNLSAIGAALLKYDVFRQEGKRFNELGIQQISGELHQRLFPSAVTKPRHDLIDLSRRHLHQHDLLGKNAEAAQEISFNVPNIRGSNLDEHFHRLGLETAEPYLSLAKSFSSQELPHRPESWEYQAGWTRYNENGSVSQVDYPDEECLSFDTEVLYKITPYPVMACAVGKNAWYSWVSPWLMGFTRDMKQLIPMGNDRHKLIVGHNIGYDRSRILEEYDIKRSKLRFVDTLSLHQAANGMCSKQRPTWMKHRKRAEMRTKILAERPDELESVLDGLEEDVVDDLWISKSSANSLRDVANFHCDTKPDKELRKYFDSTDRKVILNNFALLMSYCAEDVRLAHLVYCKVLPNYLEIAPHPSSFSGLLHMNSMILPVTEAWTHYIQTAEAKYQELSIEIHRKLVTLAEENVKLKDSPDVFTNDPWLKQLDWTIKPVRMVKNKKTGEERLAKNQKLPGMPQWYRDLFTSAGDTGEMNLTTRTRISPLLLKINWNGSPLVWSDKYGWVIRASDETSVELFTAQNYQALDMSKESIQALQEDNTAIYFKVPHKDGPTARVASPLAKAFDTHFENGIMSSEFPLAKEALKMNAMCSYWISSRDRIMSQMVVWQKNLKTPHEMKVMGLQGTGIILPQTVAMGTITRRATEATWMTASNAKSKRVGSELKSMVKAPPGYCFVGADVDSEELWIASLMGDAQFQAHGATALGWMTLEGSKNNGTDLHSKTASILGISRGNAKIFNYGRIYGAGLKFAIQLLQQFNPQLTEARAKETAERLYEATKGSKSKIKALGKKGFWRGGTESYVFNRLEAMAELDQPRTPVLGCRITQALQAKYLSPGAFLTSRVNWAIQSSGVDYLHLLITSMEYLIKVFDLNARISITVHDEIRYLVATKDRYLAAYALQVSNLWTRAMFSQQMGINDLPQSCAFFSEVDIDHVLRKETKDPCVTPSHPDPIPPGDSYSIQQLLEILKDEPRLHNFTEPDLSHWPYTPRARVFEDSNREDLKFLEAQNMKDIKDVERLYSSKPATRKRDSKL
ncbi:DNA polymerase gamma [Taphrina deformans PYCC 5710]|uniref:DNA-directed DNA polymerase n=1 Tax=Taphrina deformans (strain PYCC 5710 / ATCC 11124 / CBS 356.35 / IMI 108563 / JCM 9778 / NBRC 8474) TaxID=1097556 RepID=R4X7K6_TAPDE|nr:DNA polymerase gamma [Taphrina deformans PYCC 5710]|eukprot:CCG81108.1 DNA polymerase gamma [Taphrina deformans PYCC 5710]